MLLGIGAWPVGTSDWTTSTDVELVACRCALAVVEAVAAGGLLGLLQHDGGGEGVDLPSSSHLGGYLPSARSPTTCVILLHKVVIVSNTRAEFAHRLRTRNYSSTVHTSIH